MPRLLVRILFAFVIAVAVTVTAAPPAGASWVWPARGDVITPYRNGTDPYATGQHRGIDIAAPTGAAVRAAAGGDVRFAGTSGSSGLAISIRTADGYDTSYLHLSSLEVRAGARVSAGARIGAVGTTGTTGTRSATTPHLHFGVRTAGTRHAYHDPLALLSPAPPASPAPEPPPPAPAPRPEPSPPEPVREPLPAPVPEPLPRGAQLATEAPKPHAPPHPGRDIGWLLACAGLLLAGAVLGLTEDGRGATKRAGSKLRDARPRTFSRAPFARG
jgi:hypothetical protein